jgi:hypothetical protein
MVSTMMSTMMSTSDCIAGLSMYKWDCGLSYVKELFRISVE